MGSCPIYISFDAGVVHLLSWVCVTYHVLRLSGGGCALAFASGLRSWETQLLLMWPATGAAPVALPSQGLCPQAHSHAVSVV